jgi:hypothetical protein
VTGASGAAGPQGPQGPQGIANIYYVASQSSFPLNYLYTTVATLSVSAGWYSISSTTIINNGSSTPVTVVCQLQAEALYTQSGIITVLGGGEATLQTQAVTGFTGPGTVSLECYDPTFSTSASDTQITAIQGTNLIMQTNQ